MFSVSEYLSRIEQAALDILESMKPIDKTITLWWGLDGLRLNEDGTTEWVSRKKKSVEPVFYQPCQSIQPIHAGVLLSDHMIQQYCVQYPAQYPPYYYGGCCCNFMG